MVKGNQPVGDGGLSLTSGRLGVVDPVDEGLVLCDGGNDRLLTVGTVDDQLLVGGHRRRLVQGATDGDCLADDLVCQRHETFFTLPTTDWQNKLERLYLASFALRFVSGCGHISTQIIRLACKTCQGKTL